MNRWMDEEILNPAICNDGEALRGHYAKWNKPDTVRQILHDFTCEILKQTKPS